MMTKCWETSTADRPTFSEISDFLYDILKSAGQDASQPPASGKEEGQYSYARSFTKDIPSDYETCDPDGLVECYVFEEDYLQPDKKHSENPYLSETVTFT